VQTYHGAVRMHRLQRDLHAALRALSRQQDVTLFMVLMAAFQVLLYRMTGQDDVTVGTAVAGRNQLETENLIGFFINMLPIRSDLSGNPSFSDLLGQVRETAIGAFEHQDVPIEKVIEELPAGRQGGHNPFFQVAFGVRNEGRQGLDLPGLSFDVLPLDYDSVRLDLSIWVSEEAEGMIGTWFYNVDLFDASTIESMQEKYSALLASIVADPPAPLRSLDFVGEEERQRQQERKLARQNEEIVKVKAGRRKGVAIRTGDKEP
jgi:non-ribosomal peptide synthetase component F